MVPTTCPSQCTGGCSGTTCIANCNGGSNCQGMALTCPDYMECRVECGGVSSCQGATVNCPLYGPCEIRCTETSSCQGMVVKCGTGRCTTICSGPASSVGIVECSSSCQYDNGCGVECAGVLCNVCVSHSLHLCHGHLGVPFGIFGIPSLLVQHGELALGMPWLAAGSWRPCKNAVSWCALVCPLAALNEQKA